MYEIENEYESGTRTYGVQYGRFLMENQEQARKEPRARLFVDCDDTLVKWLKTDGQPLEGQNQYGGGSDRWEWNTELVRAIEAHFDLADVVVWSGGGARYAHHWAQRLGWDDRVTSMPKNISVPLYGEICVDDAPLKVLARLVTPEQFIAEYPVEEASA